MKREYISPIFIRQKPDSSYRLIPNLKKLNENMPYIHFNLTWKHPSQFCYSLLQGYYLASLDLKATYYSETINIDHTKVLKFIWKNQLYQFLVLPNGLCCGPRKCTKLMKPSIATLILQFILMT